MEDVLKAGVRVIKFKNGGTVTVDLNDIRTVERAGRGTELTNKNGNTFWIDLDFTELMLQLRHSVTCACKEVQVLYAEGFITVGNNLHVYNFNDRTYIEATYSGNGEYRISLINSKDERVIVSVDVKCENCTNTTVRRIIGLLKRVDKVNTIEHSLVTAGMSPSVHDVFPIKWVSKRHGRYICTVKQFGVDGSFLYVNGERITKLYTARETKKALYSFQISLDPLQNRLAALNFNRVNITAGLELTEFSYSLQKNGKLFTVNVYPCIDTATIETPDYVLEYTIDNLTVNIARLLAEV